MRAAWLNGRNAAWAERYGGGWPKVEAFVNASKTHWEDERRARDARQREELEKAQRLAEAERLAKEAAEVAAREAAARTETEQKARLQAQASAGKLRRALVGVAVAGLAALIGLGVSFYYFRQASEQSERARADEIRATELAEERQRAVDQLKSKTEEVEREAQRTQTALDSANKALAEAINSDLVFDPNSLAAPRTRDALWRLARADEAVKNDFVSVLAESPDETARAAPGFVPIARALELLRPSPDEAQRLLGAAIKAISTADGRNASESLAAEIGALASKLTEAQAGQALDPVLKQIGQTTDPGALRRWRRRLQALAAKLSEAQAGQALDQVLKQIGQTTDPDALQALAQALQALAAKLSEAQASQALDRCSSRSARRPIPTRSRRWRRRSRRWRPS